MCRACGEGVYCAPMLAIDVNIPATDSRKRNNKAKQSWWSGNPSAMVRALSAHASSRSY